MYEDSVAVPVIAAGPDIPEGLCVPTPTSLVDRHPTLLDFAGETSHPDDTDLPGESLIARFDDPGTERAVFSEYYDWSAITGMFMLRTFRWKIVRYPVILISFSTCRPIRRSKAIWQPIQPMQIPCGKCRRVWPKSWISTR